MRPVELEMVGFSAFRDRVVVDFRDVDFFALVGPTGAGKSSVIDAICFALYGAVPRYGDRRLVAPAITQGATEARIRFTFAVDDHELSAVRVVRRTASGATTREARLERNGTEVLAGSADELTAEVERLLGLPFEHFTRCVVLPQGEFARFLHDKPRDRQQLLVQLLDLGIYDTMRAEARARAERAGGERLQLESRLAGELATATPEAAKAATARLQALGRLRKAVSQAEPALDELRREADAAAAARATADGWVQALAAVRVPDGVTGLAEQVREATEAVAAAEAAVAAAERDLVDVDAARAALGDATPLTEARAAHTARRRVAAELDERQGALAEAEAAAEAARRALDEREARWEAAREAKEAAEHGHLAAAVAASLTPGAPCPVCLQVVAALPDRPAVPAVKAAAGALAKEEKALAAARKAAAEAERRLAEQAGRHATVRDRLAELDAALQVAPDEEALAAALAAIEQADAALAAARQRVTAARKAEAAARRDRAALDRALDDARGALLAVRDAVVPLGPPAPEGADLAADWAALVAWAEEQHVAQVRARDAAAARGAELAARREEVEAELVALCAAEGVAVGRRTPLEAVAAAEAAAVAEAERIARLLAEAEAARERLAAVTAERDVAQRLAQHLAANRFEKWLLDEAMARLVAGATDVLASLTDGQYELDVDASGTFVVVDHHNAGERRLARTLSGGETFLASLALALALADHLAALASEGAARLDAIFLDEGFGTLDPDTLDTVATAMEQLGASGRMVGLVTHVRELADRVPVRYEVTKDDRTARVERVLA